MRKANIPNQKKAYKNLAKRLNNYTKKVLAIYSVLAKEASNIAISTHFDGDGEFSFANFPKTQKRVDNLLKYFSENMEALVYDSISKEWKNSNTLQDLLARRVIRSYTRKVGEEKQKTYYEHDNAALDAFTKRKKYGLNLSERIWNQEKDVRENLEKALATGIEKGMSAVKLSKKVSQYLNDYPKLAKDYKKKFGKAMEISACEYRSVRLARNEINMAYRAAEQMRWARMDYIKAKEIKTSRSASHKKDMCDQLAGTYPKDFSWTGWHVNCMCYAIPIIMSEEEYWDGKPKPQIIDGPEKVNKYIEKNEVNILKSKNTPYFITNNEQHITSKAVLKSIRWEQYLKYKSDPNYKNVAISSKGGLKAIHVEHTDTAKGQTPCLDGLTGYDLEKEFQDLAFYNGHSVILCKEGEQIPNSNAQYKSLDMFFDGVRMDIKSVCTDSGSYRNQIKAKNDQLYIWNKQQNDTSNSVCLYFRHKEMFHEEYMDKSYRSFMDAAKKNKCHIVIKNIVCAIRDGENLIIKRFSY